MATFSIGRFLALSSLGLALSGSTQAGIVFLNSRAAWQQAAGSSPFTEDFSGFTRITPFRTAPLPLNGMTIQQEGTERLAWNEVDVPPFQFAYNNGTSAALLLTNYPEGGSSGLQVRITFNVANKAFGLEGWSVNDGEGVVMDVFRGTTLVGSQALNDKDGGFTGYVLTGSDRATSVRLRSARLIPGMAGERFYIDNLVGVSDETLAPGPQGHSGLRRR